MITAYKPKMDDEDYLNNWVDKLDLMCLSDARIGLLGSSFFFGLFIGLPFIPSLGDKYGRKIVFHYTLIITMVAALGLHFSRNYNFTLFCTFTMGVLWNGKNIIGMSYADELLHKDYRKDYITAMFIIGSFVMFSIPLVYITITRSWYFQSYLMLSWAAGALCICPFYIPESPKYLYTKGRFDEARQSLFVIARHNRVCIMENIMFDKEDPKYIKREDE
jgi:MFS family permease